jgi:hypothetical protein
MGAHNKLAGSQEEAVKGALEVEHAMVKMHAATDGVKAALVTGLAPALTTVIGKLTAWFVDHRADVAKWAAEIGEKLPGAIQSVVEWIDKAYAKVTTFIDKIGGLQTVALAVAAAITGPLIASIITLGVAMMSSPAGLVLAGLGALALGIAHVAMTDQEDRSPTSLAATGGEGYEAGSGFNAASDRIGAKRNAATLPTVEHPMIPSRALPTSAFPLVPAQQPTTANIKVEFMNAPRGMRVSSDSRGPAQLDLTTGYQVMGFGT